MTLTHYIYIYIYIYILYYYIFYIKPVKSEAIHETGLSGNVVTSFFPLIIYIYIYLSNKAHFLSVCRRNCY